MCFGGIFMEPRSKTRIRFALLSVLVLACLFFTQGCSSKEEKVTRFIQKGDRLLSEGDQAKALLEYKNAVQLDPKSAAAQYALGKGFLQQKEPRQAFGAFKEATELKPDFDEARLEVAFILSLSGAGRETLDELAKLKDFQAAQPKSGLSKSRAFMNMKRFDEAIAELSAIKDVEANPDAQALLTICYRETHDYGRMLQAASKWRTLAPKDHRPYVFIARHAAEQGDKDRVFKELDALVTMNPQESQYKLLRAAALEDFGFMEDAEFAFSQLPPELEMLRAQAGFWQRRQKTDKAQNILEQLLAKVPNDTEALLQLCHVLINKGDTTGATARLDKALQQELIQPDREKLMLAKASLKADQKELTTAKGLCNEVLKQNQGNMDAHFLLGQLYLREGNVEDAELHLSQVAVARPNDANAQILLSKTQRLNNKEAMALETLRNALKANKGSIEIRMELVDYCIGQKDYDQALKQLDQGLEARPAEPAFLNKRGEIYAAKKDYKKAEQDFREIIRVQPNSPVGYLKLGQLMLATSKPDEAIDAFGKALRSDDTWHLALPGLVSAFLTKKDTKAAVAAVEVEARKRSQAPLAHYYLAQVYAKTGSPDKSEAPLLEAIKLAPDWNEPYQSLSDYYETKGKTKEAQKRFEELHKKNPTPASTMTLALLYEQQSKTREADALYNELLEKSSKAPSVLNNIAFLFAEHRKDPQDLKKAAEMASLALSKQPQNTAYLDTLAWVSFKQGKIDDAWNRLKEVLVRQPDAPSVNLHVAVVAHARGEKELAKQHLDKVIRQETDPYSQKQALAIRKGWEG